MQCNEMQCCNTMQCTAYVFVYVYTMALTAASDLLEPELLLQLR